MADRLFYNLYEAAEVAGIGLTKLREEIAAQRLVARKLGKRTLIKISDLESWAENLPEAEIAHAAA